MSKKKKIDPIAYRRSRVKLLSAEERALLAQRKLIFAFVSDHCGDPSQYEQQMKHVRRIDERAREVRQDLKGVRGAITAASSSTS